MMLSVLLRKRTAGHATLDREASSGALSQRDPSFQCLGYPVLLAWVLLLRNTLLFCFAAFLKSLP